MLNKYKNNRCLCGRYYIIP